MMPRIQIKTPVPANTEVAFARTQARIAAAEQVGLHIVEETLLPVLAHRAEIDPSDGIGVEPGVNDHTVDRVLTTWWEFHK